MLKKLFKPKFAKFDKKYTTLSAHDESIMQMVVADITDYVKKSKKINNLDHHTRAVHAKGYCALKAKFEILDNLPEAYAQGLYAKAGTHDAVIRFSNAQGNIAPDRRLGMGIGLAFKIFDVPGKKLTPDDPDCTTFDYALVNSPIFFTNSVEDYAYLSKLVFGVNEYLGNNNLGLLKFGFHWLTKYGKELPDLQGLQTLNAFRKIATVKPKNPWLYDYFSQGVVRHGDYMGKIRITPTKSAKQKIKQPKIHLFTKDEAIRPVLLDEIRTHDYEYDVQIQLCRNVKKQPIEKITQEWDESKAPFVTIGKLTIPKQEVTDDGNFAAMEHLSFSVFRALEENRPIGRIQQSRLQAYRTSSKVRHEQNAVQRREPASLAQVFDTSAFV